jgi:ubiquinone biosynthesis protein
MSTMRTVYTNIRAARTAIKDVVRLRQIASVLVRHGYGHVVEAWNLQDKAVVGLLIERRDPDTDRLTGPERITRALQELGPTFVKLGQILSTRPDLVPPELCAQLETLQASVAPITYEEAKEVVEVSLGRPVTDVFEDFSIEPLASASIAQVHTARLLDGGEEVVIKIQRPGIRQVIDADLHILYWLARQLEQTVPEAAAFDPVAIIREFDRAISRELSFKYEASNLQRIARNFSSWDTVYIPHLYGDYSSDTIMVMERLRAHKITEAAEHGHYMDPIARECVRMVFKMAYEDGFFHGDLHPGNLLILDDGRIGLIDFGLVGRMTQTMKDAMADLVLGIVTRNDESVARSLFEMSVRNGHVDYAAFEQDVSELLSIHFDSASLADVDFGVCLRDIVNGAIRHNLRVPPEYTMFFKALMTVEGIGKIVSPDLDLVSELRPYVEQLVAQRYGPERVLRNVVDTLQSFGRFARQFPISAGAFLSQLEQGKVSLGLDLNQLSELEDNRDRRNNRIVLAAFVCVLFLVGAWSRDDTDVTFFGLPALSFFSFTFGGVLGFRVLWRILREGKW